MGCEIRKERDFWGNEKEVMYEHGEKVGEIRKEKDFFGEKTNVYDREGNRAGEIRSAHGFFGKGTNVYNRDGGKVGEISQDRDFFGERDVERGRDASGNKVAFVRKGGLTHFYEQRKAGAAEQRGASESSSRSLETRVDRSSSSDGYSPSESSVEYRGRQVERQREQHGQSFWTFVYESLASLFASFGKTSTAKRFYLHAAEANMCDRNFKRAAEMAERGGDLKLALRYYENAGLPREVIRVGLEAKEPDPVIRMYLRENDYQAAADVARDYGLQERADALQRTVDLEEEARLARYGLKPNKKRS